MLNEEFRSTNVFTNTGDGFEKVESDYQAYVEAASKQYFEKLGDTNATVVSVGHFWSSEDGIAIPGISVKSSTIDKQLDPFDDPKVDRHYNFFTNLLQPPDFQELSFEEKVEYYREEFGDIDQELEEDEDILYDTYSSEDWPLARHEAQEALKNSVLDQFESLNLSISREEIENAFDETEQSL